MPPPSQMIVMLRCYRATVLLCYNNASSFTNYSDLLQYIFFFTNDSDATVLQCYSATMPPSSQMIVMLRCPGADNNAPVQSTVVCVAIYFFSFQKILLVWITAVRSCGAYTKIWKAVFLVYFSIVYFQRSVFQKVYVLKFRTRVE